MEVKDFVKLFNQESEIKLDDKGNFYIKDNYLSITKVKKTSDNSYIVDFIINNGIEEKGYTAGSLLSFSFILRGFAVLMNKSSSSKFMFN